MRSLIACLALLPALAFAWSNGPNGNAQTNEHSECGDPPYATHDFVADQGLMMLPTNERAWIMQYRAMYLLGTEAPDNDDIPISCGSPNTGYDDRRRGHSVEWNSNFSAFMTTSDGGIKDRAARRAQEEYGKAVIAFEQGRA